MIKFGTDPEFLIVDSKNRPVPAHILFPGKDEKIVVPIKSRGNGNLFRDGYALEINVPPSHCRSVLTDSMRFMLESAKKRLPGGFALVATPAWPILLESLRGAPSDVRQFGCDPALNAYTGEETHVELDGETHRYRYAGGHLHFSVSPVPKWLRNFKAVRLFVKFMDLRIGLPLTYLYGDTPTFLRRRVYGRAGEFRLQSYPTGEAGIEYRVPDPRVWNNPAVAMMALGVGRSLIRAFGKQVPTGLPIDEGVLQRAINEGVHLKESLMPYRGWYKTSTLERAAAEKSFQVFSLGKPVPSGQNCFFPGWDEWRKQSIVS